MPLEINEIGIRMRVLDASSEKGEDGQVGKDKVEVGCDETLDRARVVDECVQRVLKILKAQRER